MATFPVTTKRIRAWFERREDRTAYDPNTIVFTVTHPDGTESVYTWGSSQNVERVDEGVYDCFYDADAPGRWMVHVQTNDPNAKSSGFVTDDISDLSGSVG